MQECIILILLLILPEIQAGGDPVATIIGSDATSSSNFDANGDVASRYLSKLFIV